MLKNIVTIQLVTKDMYRGDRQMKKQTILVVDDDREIVRAISKLLELEGYETLKAYDGLEALDIIVEHAVHLIIMDVMMPKLN